jgi:hypothetical protein
MTCKRHAAEFKDLILTGYLLELTALFFYKESVSALDDSFHPVREPADARCRS